MKTARDLLAKMEADLLRFRSAMPASRDAQYAAAFDFFVAAHHLPEWVDRSGPVRARKLKRHSDAELVAQVANGAKHFSLRPARRSREMVSTSVQAGAFQADAFQRNAFQTEDLVIQMGARKSESVLAVAERVMMHWRAVLA